MIAKPHVYGLTIYQIANKEQKLILNLAYERRSPLEYHRVPFLVPFCSTSLCVICFCFYMKPNLLAMQMITYLFVVRDNITDVISAIEEIGEKLLIIK